MTNILRSSIVLLLVGTLTGIGFHGTNIGLPIPFYMAGTAINQFTGEMMKPQFHSVLLLVDILIYYILAVITSLLFKLKK